MNPRFTSKRRREIVMSMNVRYANYNAVQDVMETFQCSEAIARKLLAKSIRSTIVMNEILNHARYEITGEV